MRRYGAIGRAYAFPVNNRRVVLIPDGMESAFQGGCGVDLGAPGRNSVPAHHADNLSDSVRDLVRAKILHDAACIEHGG